MNINSGAAQPEKDSHLTRYGVKWMGKKNPICTPMLDGYWTPWHVAQAEIDALKAEIEALKPISRCHENAQKPISVNDELPPFDVPVFGFWINCGRLKWWIFRRVDEPDFDVSWAMCANQDDDECDEHEITHWLPLFDLEAVEQFLKSEVQNG